MMGDNRDDSFDSRYFGAVERKRIVGQATSGLPPKLVMMTPVEAVRRVALFRPDVAEHAVLGLFARAEI